MVVGPTSTTKQKMGLGEVALTVGHVSYKLALWPGWSRHGLGGERWGGCGKPAPEENPSPRWSLGQLFSQSGLKPRLGID